MAMSVKYTTIFGQIVHDLRAGVESFYVPDPLGNTAALVDTTGAITDTWSYWPYGEVQNHTGSSTTPITFMGTLGYFADVTTRLYVRARYLRADLTRWVTTDEWWPVELAYSYARLRPGVLPDPSGLGQTVKQCVANAILNLATPFEACEYCERTVGRLSATAADYMCSHWDLPPTMGPGRPRVGVPKRHGAPPPSLNPILDIALTAAGYGCGVPEPLALIQAPNSAVCVSILTKLDRLNDNYCASGDESPGRGKYPKVPEQYWQNYCAYLDWLINEWKTFCARSS